MIIRKADPDQFPDVREFYYAVIDGIGDSNDSAGWKKDIYPTQESLLDFINRGELYIAVENEMIVGAMALNHQFNDEYRTVPWSVQAENSAVTVIHILAVHPEYTRKGYAKKLVQYAIDHSRSSGQRVIRLDVLKGNIAAKKLYTVMGFQYVAALPMFYEDVGCTEFELYEYSLD